VPAPRQTPTQRCDVLIRYGRVLDGSGNPRLSAVTEVDDGSGV
jgi:N-acyl-D-aspartate/D-glutamate deacylase